MLQSATVPSDPPQSVEPRRGGFRRLLAPGHWAYILLLFVPLTIVDVLCQTQRSVGTGVQFGSWEYFDAIRSVVLFDLAVIVFWVGAFALVRGRRARWWLTLALHICFTVLALVVVIGEVYFLLLDVVINTESFELIRLIFQVEMFKIIQAEIKGGALLGVLVVLVLSNFFPVVVNRWWKPRWLHKMPESTDSTDATAGTDSTATDDATATPAPVSRGRVALGTAAVCAVLLVLSGLPDLYGTTNFTRARPLSFAMDAVHMELQGEPAGFREPTAADLPLHTHLVPTKQTKKYNIVELVLESQSWKSTTLGTPSLPTTPHLVDLARTGLVGEHAYTVVPHTTKSLIASNCGVPPPLDTANSEAEPGGLAAKCLPRLLREQGYNTAFFQSATRNFENRQKVVNAFGYQHFYSSEDLDHKDFSKVNTLGYEDDAMIGPSIKWARQQNGKPFLMEFMTVTAHAEYVLPKGFPEKHYVDDEVHNRYLNAVRYQDRFVGKIIKHFKRLGLYKNTIFVVMGDHGEGFREHGRRLHNDTIWNEGLQIPYVIHAPNAWRKGHTLQRPVQNMATLPTLVDLLGYKIKGGHYAAISARKDRTDPGPLISSCWDIDQCIAYFDGSGHKYIHFFGYRPDEYFDLNTDPGEEHNLFDTLPESKQKSLEHRVLLWQAEVNARHELSRRLAK